MVKKVLKNLIGSWAFLVGVLLAIITGLITGLGWADLDQVLVTNVLVVIGVIIGLLNITSKETIAFLLSGVVLIIASVFGMAVMVTVPAAGAILAALLAIFVPSTIIVAIRHVFGMAKN